MNGSEALLVEATLQIERLDVMHEREGQVQMTPGSWLR